VTGKALIGSTTKKHSGRGKNARIMLGEEILRRRNRGEKMPEIAAKLDLALSTAERYLRLALDTRLPLSIDEFRKQQNDRLDEIQEKADEQVQLSERLAQEGVNRADPDLILKAANLRAQALALQIRIDERRAKLNGLDAPVVVEATVRHTDVDPDVEELIESRRANVRAVPT
jgi:vacuolar-type H+-ATPase subunit E/Vma4